VFARSKTKPNSHACDLSREVRDTVFEVVDVVVAVWPNWVLHVCLLLPHMLAPLVSHAVSLAVAQEFAILCILTHVTITTKYSLKYNHKEISTLLATLLLCPNASLNLANALPTSTRTTSFLCDWEILATGRTNS